MILRFVIFLFALNVLNSFFRQITNTNSVINSKVNNYNKEENNLRKQLIDKDKLLLEKEKEISELKNEIRNNQFNKLKLNQNYSDSQKEIIQ